MSKPKAIQASGIPVHCAHLRIADVTSLIPNPRNPNKHGDTQVALLAKIIRHQGWRAPITISRRSGFIVTGHGRLEAAKLLQVAEVPVDEQDFATEADEWAHLIADNRIAELADADRAIAEYRAENWVGLEAVNWDAIEIREHADGDAYLANVPSISVGGPHYWLDSAIGAKAHGYDMTQPQPDVAKLEPVHSPVLCW